MPQTQTQSEQSYASSVDAQSDSHIDVQAAAAPTIHTWRFPRQQGMTVSGTERITITNMTDTPMIVRMDRLQADLKGRDMLTLNLDPNRSQTIELEAPEGGEAGGFFVLHDLDSRWQVPSIGARDELSFKGPDTFALINHPKSTLVVEWLAQGIQRDTFDPGEADEAFFSREDAKNMAVAGPAQHLGSRLSRGSDLLYASKRRSSRLKHRPQKPLACFLGTIPEHLSQELCTS